MKKVLIVVPSFSSGGGAEKILSKILCNGDFSNYYIDIVEVVHGNKGYESLPKDIKVKGYYIRENSSRFLKLCLYFIGKKFPRFVRKKLISDDNYDVEIMFEIMYPDIPFTKKNTKKIYWVHGSIEEFSEKKYEWRKENYYNHFKNSNCIVAISKKTKKSIECLYPQVKEKIKLIYNGYDFSEIEAKSLDKVDIDIFEDSICSVGRIEKKKGSDRNLEILKLLHDEGYKYHLYYIGDGELRKELESRAKLYNLESYVHFLGYVNNPYKYMKKIKILLSMSEQEGFPGVYVEAMSMGLPFVSTDVGGAEELSQNGEYGKIIKTNDEAKYAIINYIEKEDINKEKMKKFVCNFSLNNQIEEFEKILKI